MRVVIPIVATWVAQAYARCIPEMVLNAAEKEAFTTSRCSTSSGNNMVARSAPPMNDDDSGNGGTAFSYPFVTLAVVAVAVFVLIVVLIAVRMTIWNRRAQRRAHEMNDEQYIPSYPMQLPQDPMQPPPLLEKTVSPVAPKDPSTLTPASAADWSALQPVSVCFDKETSNRIHTTLNAPPGITDPWTRDCMPANAQVTCLVSLPTSRTVFPARLRRRHTKEAKSSVFTPFFSGESDAHQSYECDLSSDLSHQQKRPASLYSRASVKELSDARRDAYFEDMEKQAERGESGLAPPPPMARENSRVSMPSTYEQDNEDNEHVGIFAFGSVVLPINKAASKNASPGGSANVTKADVMGIIDQTHRVQGPMKM